MKTRCFFIIALFCLIFSIQMVQAQALTQKISLTVKDATLPQVLQKIQKQYAVRFSYLNNSLPTQQRFSAEVKDKTLAEVLDVLLAQTDIGYLEKNGQVIIKKGLPKKQPKATTLKKMPVATPESKSGRGNTVIETKVTTTVKPDGSVANKVETKTKPAKNTPPQKETQPKSETKAPVTDAKPADNTPETTNTVTEETPVADAGTATEVTDTLANEEGFRISVKKLLPKFKLRLPTLDEDTSEVRPYHFGFIYPLSTNGIHANRYVNRISLHALVGTSAGVQGAEFAGLVSNTRKYVNGAQFSGLFNVAGNPGGVNKGYSLRGGQFAGLLNISSADSWGVQSAGFLNISKNMEGAQFAGFMNVADTVKGVQAAGFLNKAKFVKGSQIGFINVSDTLTGVPIGLINIVKRGGYRRLEAYHADDFDANLTYKIGVHKFYNIIALGVELKGAQRWGYGAGFGSEWKLTNWFRINTDVLSYYVIEESWESFPSGLFEDYQLNLLNKFRLLGTLQLGKRMALFGGPVYNVFVSEREELPEFAPANARLVSKTFYNRTGGDGTNVKMWIGFNAGIRF